MICPVCEHAQERGVECDLCGARLAAAPPTTVTTTPLLDLEPTALADAGAAAMAPPQPQGETWIEPTAVSPVDVAVETFEVERAADDGVRRDRTPAAAPSCRYCRTPAAPGQQFCGGCGMRLRSYERPAAHSAPPPVRCHGCGTVITGPLCPGCGARAPSAGRGEDGR